MQPSPTMQQVIQLLAEKHGLTLSQEGAHLRLTMDGYQPLVIENIGLSRVVVAHYFTYNGDLVPDPTVTFFTGDLSGWIPMGITHSFCGSHTYAVVTDDGAQVVCFAHHRQAELSEFTEMWAQNLIDQGWLAHGQTSQSPGARKAAILAPLFPLGRVVATPGALEALQEAGKDPRAYLDRHARGDWGDLPTEDVQANQRALQDGSRLVSAYQVAATLRVWIISEWDRSVTTVLLPSEY